MYRIIAIGGFIALGGLSSCESASEPPEFDNREGDVTIGRVVEQDRDSLIVTDFVRARFVHNDYKDHQMTLVSQSPFAVHSVRVSGYPLPLLDPDSLIYGFASTDRTPRLAAGKQVVEVQAAADFASYRHEIVVPTDARIVSPSPGDSISMSEGFWAEWDNHGSKADQIDVGVASNVWPSVVIGNPTDDDGRVWLKDFDMGIMQPGPARIVVTRRNSYQEWVTTGNLSRITATSTVAIPIVLVP